MRCPPSIFVLKIEVKSFFKVTIPMQKSWSAAPGPRMSTDDYDVDNDNDDYEKKLQKLLNKQWKRIKMQIAQKIDDRTERERGEQV